MTYVLNDVLFGENGWLFAWQGTNAMHDILQGKKALSAEEIRDWDAELKARQSFCSARNTIFHFVIVPLKQCVYADQLSDYPLSPKRPAMQLSRHTLAHYPIDFLKELKLHSPVYCRYDTHWNDFACNALFASLLGQERSDRLQEYTDTPPHDLWVKISKAPCPPERLWRFEKNNVLVYNEIENAGGFIFCENPQHPPLTGIIFGDSFSRFCINTISQYFSHLFFFHTTGFDRQIINRIKPDIVINCQAENFIHCLEKVRFADYFESLLYKFLISGKNCLLQKNMLKTYSLFMAEQQIQILEELILLFAKGFSMEQILAHLCRQHGMDKHRLQKLLAYKKTP